MPRRHAALIAALAVLGLLSVSAPHAHAAVFEKAARDPRTGLSIPLRWPASFNGGPTLIPVCITDDSSATQSKGGVVNDPNPSLDAVVGRIRDALRRTWEGGTSIRFVD